MRIAMEASVTNASAEHARGRFAERVTSSIHVVDCALSGRKALHSCILREEDIRIDGKH
jgi:hypothetical protein